VAGERGVVSHHDLVSDAAIVCDVRKRHEEVVAADDREATTADGAAVHGGELAEYIAIADLEARGLALVLEILRRVADRRELENLVLGADGGRPLDDGVRPDPGARTDAHAFLDHRVRADDDVGGKL